MSVVHPIRKNDTMRATNSEPEQNQRISAVTDSTTAKARWNEHESAPASADANGCACSGAANAIPSHTRPLFCLQSACPLTVEVVVLDIEERVAVVRDHGRQLILIVLHPARSTAHASAHAGTQHTVRHTLTSPSCNVLTMGRALQRLAEALPQPLCPSAVGSSVCLSVWLCCSYRCFVNFSDTLIGISPL